MISPENWKHLSDLWSAAGPLIGVYIGSQLAARSHRRDWIADNKKEEYRELISTLTKSMSTIHGMWGAILNPDDQRSRAKAYTDVLEVNRSRIFIANEIKHLRIAE